jgi:Cd2+/Zn2+-exporting ATPase
MEDQSHFSSESNSDAATHVVITHLHARIAELETQVASLQQQQTQQQTEQQTQPSLVKKGKELVSTVRTQHVPRLRSLKPRTLLDNLPTLPWQKRRSDETTSDEPAWETDETFRDGYQPVTTAHTTAVGDTDSPTPKEEQQNSAAASQPTTTATASTDSNSLEEEEERLAELPQMVMMTIITLVSLLLGWASETFLPFPAIAWVLYATAYINGSFYSVQEAWQSLKERQFDVNLLMIAAALGAAAIGQPLEGAVLMFLFSLSQTLETYAMGRTHASIHALLAMTPQTARVLRMQKNGTELEEELPIEQVEVGEIVRVRPGENIPADGVVVRGSSAVNEASITGESLPVEKQRDANVFAGTLNGQGALDVRVTTAIDDSTLAHVVKIVSEAREQKAKSQHFTDRVIGQYYAYTVVGITLLAIIVPLVFMGWDVRTTVYRAITLMVGASPCALVISIPAALLSALASASWGGVLFKGGKHLESASKVKVVAFDKTGTLTTGQPGVMDVLPMEEKVPCNGVELPAERSDTLSEQQARLLGAAAAIEQFSEHPLAKAVVQAARNHQIGLPEAHDFEALAGFGVRATMGGRQVQVGRPSLFAQVQEQTLPAAFAEQIAAQEQQGRTVILVGEPQQVWGALTLADTVRPESSEIVASLKAAGVERVVLLTGDNRSVANHLAQEVGIDEVWAELTPQQKVEAIRKLQAAKQSVAMIGDGINDAPALATATLGVAMGAAGTDVAMESADVVLMSDDLSRLPGMLRLARRTRAVVRQNLVFAFAVMLVLMTLALLGVLPLTLATVAHEGSTLLVVANGLRLLVPWR